MQYSELSIAETPARLLLLTASFLTPAQQLTFALAESRLAAVVLPVLESQVLLQSLCPLPDAELLHQLPLDRQRLMLDECWLPVGSGLATRFSNSLALVKHKVNELLGDRALALQFVKVVLEALRCPEVPMPKLRRRHLHQQMKTEFQLFLTYVLEQNDQVQLLDDQLLQTLRSKLDNLPLDEANVRDKQILRLRYQPYAGPFSTGQAAADLAAALLALFGCFFQGVVRNFTFSQAVLQEQEVLGLLLLRHRSVVFSMCQLQKTVGFIFQRVDQVVAQLYPEYPQFPEFRLWRCFIKGWAKAFEQVYPSARSVFRTLYRRVLTSGSSGGTELIESFCESALDLSIDELRVHYIGHSKQAPTYLYKDLSELCAEEEEYQSSRKVRRLEGGLAKYVLRPSALPLSQREGEEISRDDLEIEMQSEEVAGREKQYREELYHLGSQMTLEWVEGLVDRGGETAPEAPPSIGLAVR